MSRLPRQVDPFGRTVVKHHANKPARERQDIFLKPALPYISAHKGKVIVFSVPAELITEDTRPRTDFWQDLLTCHDLGIRCVLCVEGPRLRPMKEHDERKVITPAELARIEQHLAVKRAQCMRHLTRAAYDLGNYVPIVAGNWLLAQPLGVLNALDYQRCGRVRRVYYADVHAALDAGAVVLINNPAADKRGDSYLLPVLNMVRFLCKELAADKMVCFVKALPTAWRGRAFPAWDLTAGKEKVPRPVAQFLHDAAHYFQFSDIQRAHLVPVDVEDAVLRELFTAHGAGMMVHRDVYEELRMPAEEDLVLIKQLIAPLEDAGVLRPRSLKALSTQRRQFRMIKQDGALVGCAALSPLKGKAGHAELECFAVAKEFSGHGYGGRLLRTMERIAAEKKFHHLVVMSTQSVPWFQERGYTAAPASIQLHIPAACKQRNPKILIKKLDQ